MRGARYEERGAVAVRYAVRGVLSLLAFRNTVRLSLRGCYAVLFNLSLRGALRGSSFLFKSKCREFAGNGEMRGDFFWFFVDGKFGCSDCICILC